MTIWEAAQVVLRDAQRAMHINEIYDEILKRELYTFGAKNPKSVLSQTIRQKSTANPKISEPIFRATEQSTYELTESTN